MPDVEPTDAEKAARAARELKGFEIDIFRYSEDDRLAVQTLLDRGFEKGLLPCQVEAEFAE